MKKFIAKILVIVVCALNFTACDSVNSALQMTNCKYEFGGVSNANVAGINIANLTNMNQFSSTNLIRLAAAFATKNFPLDAVINVKATNPGTVAAILQSFDWAIDLENKEMLNGTVNRAVNIPANGGSMIIPFDVGVNLMQLFNGESRDNLLNFALNLVNAGDESSKVSIRIRPKISIGGRYINMPFVRLSKTINK